MFDPPLDDDDDEELLPLDDEEDDDEDEDCDDEDDCERDYTVSQQLNLMTLILPVTFSCAVVEMSDVISSEVERRMRGWWDGGYLKYEFEDRF